VNAGLLFAVSALWFCPLSRLVAGLRDPVVATCALALCRLAGVLCCSVCGNCGKHPHSHF
jgi:hypothetical protein